MAARDQFPATRQQMVEYALDLLKANGVSIRDGRGTPIDLNAMMNQSTQMPARVQSAGLMARMRQAAQFVITGVGPENWFGPFQPLYPMADVEGPAGAKGRRYDYQVGLNLQFTPRSEEQISFGTLRNLADAYDLLRLVIETRKDQIASYDWEIALDQPNGKTSEENAEVKKFTELLEQPDRTWGWDEWIRQVTENLLVVDGNAVYPRKNRGGGLYSLDLVDPATIKMLIDVEGRTPMAPSPAYQQVIKGVPAVDYSVDELAYWMRNPRTWKAYGYSPVEQIIVTVNIAMRRQMFNLDYYKEGNVPEALIGVPESWTPDQIKEFQDQFDSMLAGVLATRRRVKFIPEAKMLLTPRDANIVLKDETDEWLARLVCYAFSVPPIALVKMVNRQAGQQIAETAREEGLLPLLHWLERKINGVLKKWGGMQKAKFRFKLDEEIDPRVAAEIRKSDVAGGIISVDEAREQLGREPRGIDDLIIVTAGGPVPLKESIEHARKEALQEPLDPREAMQAKQDMLAGGEAKPAGGGAKLVAKKPDEKKDEKKAPAEKLDLHVHLGDTHVRVPAQELPDLTVNLGGVEVKADIHQGKTVSKSIAVRRDPSTGELKGEVLEKTE